MIIGVRLIAWVQTEIHNGGMSPAGCTVCVSPFRTGRVSVGPPDLYACVPRRLYTVAVYTDAEWTPCGDTLGLFEGRPKGNARLEPGQSEVVLRPFPLFGMLELPFGGENSSPWLMPLLGVTLCVIPLTEWPLSTRGPTGINWCTDFRLCSTWSGLAV